MSCRILVADDHELVRRGLEAVFESNAELSASTVHGPIASDFGMPMSSSRYHKVGGSFTGRIGSGGAHIKLSSVNGAIRILSTADGRRVVHAD